MRHARLVALALVAALAAPAARAQEPPRPLRYHLGTDIPVAGAAALTWLALGVFRHDLAPLSC
ncbi:MAG TPA: hypothetical protein VIV59_03100, partial [Anaeromyxobacteraceae bacterium]